MNSKGIRLAALSLAVAMGLSACSTQTSTLKDTQAVKIELTAAQKTEAEAKKLNELLDQYFSESIERSPIYATYVGVNDYNNLFGEPISDKSVASDLAFEKTYLTAIEQIDESKLEGQDWLSYKIFKRDRELGIKSYEFESHLIPLSQMGGAHSYFANLGSGASAQPFNTEKDYRDFISRANGFAAYMDSSIAAMKEGANKGMVLSKPIVAKLIPQLEAHIVNDVEKSVFYGPVKSLADNETIAGSVKAKLQKEYIATIQDVIIPSYQNVRDYLQEEYILSARDTVGLYALPNGKAWYEYQIESNTTLPLTAEEFHEFGKQEVARILSEMTKVKETVGFDGDLAAFFEFLRTDEQFYFESEQAVIDGYNDVKSRINARVGTLFEIFPKADYEVRAVEPYRAASAAGASYQSPAPDGSRPGIFFINTYNLKAQPKFLMETLSIHEAAPGHHFQIAIQQEVTGLPAFRKFGGYTVFAEGWALYAESLGKEMGLFTDPYMWYGRLADEQLRAMRLVVDTGLHAFGWSREQAIEFMMTNSSMADTDVESEVERYISIPGQALAYKAGERHIRMLRNRAKQQLGENFDVKKFHTQILIDGSLPMPILEAKIDRWIKSQS
jgi:uncharacterized protein (DUF885 family)